MSTEQRRITLIQEDDGTWVAIDTELHVGGQGATREDALSELDDAVALHTGEGGERIEDEEAFMREIGLDPEEIEKEGGQELPDFMRP
jgi:predicted RNase H-like HicB family nuclease